VASKSLRVNKLSKVKAKRMVIKLERQLLKE